MSELELKEAVKEILTSAGHYGRLQAEMRSAVYESLMVKSADGKSRPESELPASCELVDSLVMEYLQWRRCPHTQQIFQAECGLKDTSTCRPSLLQQLQILDTPQTAQLPLLIGIVEHLKNEQAEK